MSETTQKAKVTVYSKPSCVQCTATYREMDKLGIKYEVADALDEMNIAAMKSLGHMQAPVIVVAKDGPGSETHWHGYVPDLIKDILK